MKISSNKFENIFKKKAVQMPETLNPHKHWRMLLFAFFIIVACLILFSLYILYEIKNDQIFQVTPVSKENGGAINQKLLDTVTNSFDKKAQKESDLKSNPPVYSDPSI